LGRRYEKAPEAAKDDGRQYEEMRKKMIPNRDFLAFISIMHHIISRINLSFQGDLPRGRTFEFDIILNGEGNEK